NFAKEKLVKDSEKIDSKNKTLKKEHEKLNTQNKNLKNVSKYQKEHMADEWLVSGLALVEEQFNSLIVIQKEIAQKKIDKKNAGDILKEAEAKYENFKYQAQLKKEKINEILKKLELEKSALNKLLGERLPRELRTKKETLLREMAFLTKISELEEHRSKLVDGTPCPLCGAEEHPYASGNIPKKDNTEKEIETLTEEIDKVEKSEDLIKALEEQALTFRNNLTDSEKLEAKAESDKNAAAKSFLDIDNSLVKERTVFENLKLSVTSKLKPLGITEIDDFEILSLPEKLKKRLLTWHEYIDKALKIEQQINVLASEVARLDAIIKTENSSLKEKQKSLQILENELIIELEKRTELYGDKIPDHEELHLNNKITNCELAEKTARSILNKIEQNLISANSNVNLLEDRISNRKIELEKLNIDFETELKNTGFLDEKSFIEARLSADEINSLKKKAKYLDDTLIDLTARQNDRIKRLNTEIEKKLTYKTTDELLPRFTELENILKQLRESISFIRHRLGENTLAKERLKEKKTVIEEYKIEYNRWNRLNNLIGSANGKKYRTFAQGLTFMLLISHANSQLEKMSDRYILISDNNESLELNVIDSYQGGEIRSTKNLSGGESFIISLTLALGLSRMASRNVKVDTLFLDEGFGTLDEETLETALETLASLHHDGKLIGIISHVPKLKERISTQINVTPQTGGKSILTGPGCQKVIQ
ncbi:MAG: chromosome segregation protein SMC, partial [Deltaproteobacteria bacterium]|nr:chromosome segregation protein SMC [Deltaproteobacteria bacterium]